MGTAAAEVLPPSSSGGLTPVSPLERVELIDVLRGFALFGVLVCNMKGFSIPLVAYFGFGADWPLLTPLDKAVDATILFLLKGKFIALFSFLFGLGLSVQMARAQVRGVSVVPRYLRRLTVLLFIGLAHCMFLWIGDVLHTYALTGFLLVLCRNASLRTLERVIVCVWGLMLLATFGFVVFGPQPGQKPDPKKEQQQKIEMQKDMDSEMQVVLHGSFTQQVAFRAKQWKKLYISPFTIGLFADLLSLFLMGLYVGKRRVLQEVEQNLGFIKKCMWFGFACLVGASLSFLPPTPQLPWLRFIRGIFQGPFSQYVFLFYAGGICLLFARSVEWRKRLALLAPVGRMALSNYLMHSILAMFIFYGRFGGLYGKMGSTWGLALSLVIFGLQIPFSAWWLSRYQFGPAEWVWRSLTYGQMQPMRVLPSIPSAGAATA